VTLPACSGSALLVCQSQYLFYVGDVAICYSSRRMVIVEYGLQIAISCLSHWTLQNRFTFSAAKTPVCTLHMIEGFVYLSSSALPFAPSVMLLCLLDSRLSWNRTCNISALSANDHLAFQNFYVVGHGAETRQ
jgi:hypothetical protein